MGKKKRGHPDLEEIIQRPWCYYCERDFDDLKILINHQKAKHFKCDRCGRRLNTAGGLSVHMTQVHKESLAAIENALPNRAGLDIEIFGMEGIPDDVAQAHQQRVIGQFAQAEAERRAVTGNPAPGTAAGNGAKKAKVEEVSDLKKRLAEHKAKKAAEQAAALGNGNHTPNGGLYGEQSPRAYAGSPAYNLPPSHMGGPPGYPQPYGQQTQLQQHPSPFPQQQPPNFGSPAAPQPYSTNPPFGSPQQYPAPPGAPTAQAFAPPYPNGPSPIYPSTSPPPPFPQQSQVQAPRNGTPVQNAPRPPSLPAPPGLPQRPAFEPPPLSASDMEKLHQGQVPGSEEAEQDQQHPPAGASSNKAHMNDNAASGAGAADSLGAAAAKAVEAAPKLSKEEERRLRKEREKNMKLIYSDNDISPEEKMAEMPRYAFVPVMA